MAISEEIKQAIIDDLKEDRLDYEEIAAKRLGDHTRKMVISRIAIKNGLSRKDRRGKHNGSNTPKVSQEKPKSDKPIKIVTFGPDARLSLIDEAITIHKGLLAGIADPYKMDKWSAALERLLEQRREEEPGDPDGDEKLLSQFTDALETHALSTQTGRCVPGLPEDPPNPDVRVCEKRQDGDPAILHSESN